MYRTAGMLGACVMAAALLGNLFAEAQDKPPASEVKADEPSTPQIAEEIRQKLHESVTFEFKDVGIRDALEAVFEKQKLDFWIDEEALREQDVSLDDVEITCKLNNVTLRAALKRILSPSKLSWVCEDAGIRVTSQADMRKSLFARIYDIAELLDEPAVEVVTPQYSAQTAQYTDPQAGGTPAQKNTQSDVAPDKILVKMVTDLTGGVPDAPWIEADGEGGMLYLFQTKNSKLLVVRQNEQAHAEIEDLMNELLSRQGDVSEGHAGSPEPKNASTTRPRKTVRIVTKRSGR